MKCRILFSGKNKKVRYESAQRVVKVKVVITTAANNIFFFREIRLDILSQVLFSLKNNRKKKQ